MEIWKPIPDFDVYEVSNRGEVRNKKTGHIKSPVFVHGYLCVTLFGNGRAVRTGVHRLVANAFISNVDNKPQVNHKDGDKSNNAVENLEWVTASENQLHMYRVLKRKCGMSGKHHSEEAKKKMSVAARNRVVSVETREKMRLGQGVLGDSKYAKKVRNIETGEIFTSIKEAGLKYGNDRNISACCLGKRKTCHGYHWEYVKDTV